MTELETERLRLRQWIAQDFPIFAHLNADPEVMAYFPAQLTQVQSDDLAKRCQAGISQRGWGLWAVELKTTQQFLGFVGLQTPNIPLVFSPCVEIGWRLAKPFWGFGYATEAASKALEFGFNDLHLTEIVSYTAVSNLRSRSVMERLGFANVHQNFEHPSIPKGHPLSEHVLCRLSQEQWYQNL